MTCYGAEAVLAAVALAVLPGSALADTALDAIRGRLGLNDDPEPTPTGGDQS